MAKAAALTPNLVMTRKGEAKPVVTQSQMPNAQGEPDAKPLAEGYYKALTVKLDRRRYEAIKAAGVAKDKRSQEIFVEALDAWLNANAQIRKSVDA